MQKLTHLIRRIWRPERADAQVSLRLRQPLALAAFLVALVWYLAAPAATTVMAAVALGGMLLAGWVWTRALAGRLQAGRRLHFPPAGGLAALQVGEELEEEISVENGSRLSALWMEFEDHSNLPGHSLAGVRGVDGRDQTRWRMTTLCTRRGIFRLGPWAILTGDPFGLFSLRLAFPGGEEVMVYPPLAPLPPDWLPKGQAVGEQRLLRQLLPAETINLATTRPYAPGDALRRIHWRSTARREALFPERGPAVKVFEPESYSSVWLIPSLDAAAHTWGEGEESSLEKLIILTASLAAQLLGERRAVGLFAGGTILPPQAGAGQLWAVLRGLAGLELAAGQPFERTLQAAARVASRRSMAIALAPLAGKTAHPVWVERLALLRSSSAHRGGAGGASAVLLLEDERADAAAVLAALAVQNIPARTIRAGEIHPQSGSYGALQRWEFVTVGTGRAYARRKPRGAASGLPGGGAYGAPQGYA